MNWSEYQRVHAGRTNLLLHLVAVPLFVAGFLCLAVAAATGSWLGVLLALAACTVALVLQGRGHRSEREAPRPFSGPVNFLRRWFTEQFVIFPMFVLSGRWWRQFRAARGSHADES